MAAEGGRIDFMFLAPPPYLAAGPGTEEPVPRTKKNPSLYSKIQGRCGEQNSVQTFVLIHPA